jgi:hypothetical protein
MWDANVPVVNALDGRVGPVQYQVRWIVKDLLLRMLLFPHLGHTSMMVTIRLSFSKQYLLMLVWGQTGGIVVKSNRNGMVVKSKRNFLGG